MNSRTAAHHLLAAFLALLLAGCATTRFAPEIAPRTPVLHDDNLGYRSVHEPGKEVLVYRTAAPRAPTAQAGSIRIRTQILELRTPTGPNPLGSPESGGHTLVWQGSVELADGRTKPASWTARFEAPDAWPGNFNVRRLVMERLDVGSRSLGLNLRIPEEVRLPRNLEDDDPDRDYALDGFSTLEFLARQSGQVFPALEGLGQPEIRLEETLAGVGRGEANRLWVAAPPGNQDLEEDLAVLSSFLWAWQTAVNLGP